MGINATKFIRSAAHHTARFFVPKRKITKNDAINFSDKTIVALIPTYKPTTSTYRLANNLFKWHSNIHVIVVDDSTPINYKNRKSLGVLSRLKLLSRKEKRVKVLRTPQNRLKAGALNFGLMYIRTRKIKPNVVITFDDDVIINRKTLPEMVRALYADSKIGCVCSLCRVKNKNKNVLTRLQALEYQGFNITKIADDGFLRGPLVMQGMLTAFRYKAMRQVKGFTPLHLIEDYDITARIKQAGWHAAIAARAEAWTYVPEHFADLWRQRVRWSFGGIGVVFSFWKSLYTVFQDLVGHLLYLSLLFLIIASFIVPNHMNVPPLLVQALIFVALVQFLLSFGFNIVMMKSYDERDRFDWLLKISILPEFIYSNMLSLVVLGSYLFFVFNLLTRRIKNTGSLPGRLKDLGAKMFNKLGYSLAWGTRN